MIKGRRDVVRLLAVFPLIVLTSCFGLGKRDDATQVGGHSSITIGAVAGAQPGVSATGTLGVVQKFAQFLEHESNLARASGHVTWLKLSALFPVLNSASQESLFGPYGGLVGIDSFLKLQERPYHAGAQFALLNKIENLCHDGVKLKSTPLFDYDSTVQLEEDGKSLGEDQKIALSAARRAWLHPYRISDPPVQTLLQLYNKVIASYGVNPINIDPKAVAKKAVCFAAIRSPLFWMGNPGKSDVIRRLALDLGNRLPTIKEFSDFEMGRLSVEQFVKQLQAEPGYLRAVKNWHQEWLGLKPVVISGRDARTQPDYVGVNLQYATWLSNIPMSVFRIEDKGSALAGEYEILLPGGYPLSSESAGLGTPQNSEYCENYSQEFDPRTVEIRWEQKNPLLSALPEAQQWERLASWVLKKDSQGKYLSPLEMVNWVESPGSITLQNGIKKIIHLNDIVAPSFEAHDLVTQKFKFTYLSGGLSSTPLDHLFSGHYEPVENPNSKYFGVFRFTDRQRVRRFSPGANGTAVEQSGKSLVSLHYSGQSVRVCNNLARFAAACAYRPPRKDMVTPFYSAYSWNASKAKSLDPSGHQFWGFDSFAHPEILAAMRCGISDYPAIEKLSTVSVSPDGVFRIPPDIDFRAYPMGYDSNVAGFNDSIDQRRINTHAYNPITEFALLASLADKEAQPEYQALMRLGKDLAEEPYALLDDILNPSGERDYRTLLTANYTFGHGEFELLMRSQGYSFPGYVPGFQNSTDERSRGTLRRIDFSALPAFSTQYLQNSLGAYPGSGSKDGSRQIYLRPEILARGTIHPKVHSGLLTMSAFMHSAGSKTRTLASRYFVRLMCGNEASIALNADQQQIHEKYIPKNETSSKQHLDRTKGCYACHVNLDPLASILGSGFQLNASYFSWGELAATPTNNVFGEQTLYGVRSFDLPSPGAFLGKEIRGGIREVGEVLADSRQFHSCATLKAFENIFGRKPAPTDLDFLDQVTDRFLNHHFYNEMVRDLVNSELYQKEN